MACACAARAGMGAAGVSVSVGAAPGRPRGGVGGFTRPRRGAPRAGLLGALRSALGGSSKGGGSKAVAGGAGRGPLGFRVDLEGHFELGEEMGRGAFGTVYRGKERATGKEFAVKEVVVPSEEYLVEELKREVSVMKAMGQSLNAVYLHEAYEDAEAGRDGLRSAYLVTELCSGGELWQRIARDAAAGTYRGEVGAARIIRSALQMCNQAHSRGVMHRDIKPQNFMFLDKGEESVLKMMDWGLATFFTEGEVLTEVCGSAYYMAPEMLDPGQYGPKADVWSVGVLGYQLLCGYLPFHDQENVRLTGTMAPELIPSAPASQGLKWFEQPKYKGFKMSRLYEDIKHGPVRLDDEAWKGISDDAKDFMRFILERDVAKRPTAKEALKHPFLALAPGSTSASADLQEQLVQRLQRFAMYDRKVKDELLKLAGAEGLAGVLSSDTQEESLQRLFKGMDTDRSGELDRDELIVGFQTMGYRVTDDEVDQLMQAADLNENGRIDIHEFVAALGDFKFNASKPDASLETFDPRR